MTRLALLLVLLLTLAGSLVLGGGPRVAAQGQLVPGNRTIAGTVNAGPTTGTSTAYVLTLNPALTAYVPDQQFSIRVHTTNTGPATLAVNTAGARPLKKWKAGALIDVEAGDLRAGQEVALLYDGTAMQVLLAATSGALVPLGDVGTLQTSGGALQTLGAYTGSSCSPPGTFTTGLTATGLLVCAPLPVLGVTASPLLTTASAQIPNGIDLAGLPTGLLRSTVSGSVASMSTVPMPAGALVGTTQAQDLDNTRVNARIFPAGSGSPLVLNLDLYDAVVVSELSGATLMANPTGAAKPLELIRFQVKTTAPQPLTWESLWSAEVGFPLPTSTSGGGVTDVFWFQYNAGSGRLALIYSSQLAAYIVPTGVVPGTYTCPSEVVIDTRGRVASMTSGACGGGAGGGAAGASGDVQFNLAGALAADRGNLMYSSPNHTLVLQNLRGSVGGSYQTFRDSLGHTGYLLTAPLTANRAWFPPDRDGTLCVQGDPACGGAGAALTMQELDGTPSGTPSVLKVSNGSLTDNGDGSFTLVTGAGGGGDFSSNTATSVDGEAVVFSGTGGKTGKRATGTGMARLTAGVLGTATAGTDYVVPAGTVATATALAANGTNCGAGQAAAGVDASGNAEGCATYATLTGTETLTNKRVTKRVTTLTSSTTYTCPGDSSDQCRMAMTAAAGTLTIAAPTGTPVDGDMLLLRFKCTNAQTFSFDAVFLASPNVPIPASCPADTTKETVVGVMYSSDLSKWLVLASN